MSEGLPIVRYNNMLSPFKVMRWLFGVTVWFIIIVVFVFIGIGLEEYLFNVLIVVIGLYFLILFLLRKQHLRCSDLEEIGYVKFVGDNLIIFLKGEATSVHVKEVDVIETGPRDQSFRGYGNFSEGVFRLQFNKQIVMVLVRTELEKKWLQGNLFPNRPRLSVSANEDV